MLPQATIVWGSGYCHTAITRCVAFLGQAYVTVTFALLPWCVLRYGPDTAVAVILGPWVQGDHTKQVLRALARFQGPLGSVLDLRAIPKDNLGGCIHHPDEGGCRHQCVLGGGEPPPPHRSLPPHTCTRTWAPCATSVGNAVKLLFV